MNSFNNFPFFDGDRNTSEIPSPETLSGYTARDWADAVLDERGTFVSRDALMMRVAEWEAASEKAGEETTSYRLSRMELRRPPQNVPVQIYHLTVMKPDRDEFTGYYIDSSQGQARKCIGDWSKAITPTKRADREMRKHLATTDVDPRGSTAVKGNIDRALKHIEKMESSKNARLLKKARRTLGKWFIKEPT